MNKFLTKISLFSIGLTSIFALTGCLPSRSLRAQEIKADLALREMRSQIEDFKYQLNKYEVELQIVEGKADSQGSTLNQVRQDLSKLNENDSNFVESTFALYDKKIEKLEGMEESLKKDLLLLKEHTQELITSLSQFKQKIDSNESQLSDQKRFIEHLKTSVEAVMKYVEGPKDADGVYYVVQPGDSLERIAKENQSTTEQLKDLNHITSDLIVVGQKLRLK